MSLPSTCDCSKKYPVAYLLDGESHFHFFTGTVTHLSSSYVIPEMIVVSIVDANRSRDLTPTHDASSFDKLNKGEKCASFRESELVPFAEARYSTTPYR